MYLTIYFGNYNVNPVLFVNGKLFLFLWFPEFTNDILKKRYLNVFLVQVVVDSEGGRESGG